MDWTPKQEKAIRGLGDPTRAGTLEEFSRSIGISERTLRRWRRIPEFREAVRRETLAAAELDLPRIFRTLAGRAIDGDVRAARLVLQATGFLDHGNRLSVSLALGRSPEALLDL